MNNSALLNTSFPTFHSPRVMPLTVPRRRVEALRSLELFANVQEVELVRLAEVSTLQRFERGATLLRCEARHEYSVLIEGRAKFSLPRGRGELALSIREPGDILSEGCSAERSTATTGDFVALVPCQVLVIPRQHMNAFLARNGAVAVRFIEAIVSRLHRLMDVAAGNSCLEIGDRLYRRLAEFAAARSQPLPGGRLQIVHGLSQAELAACVGASRESVNRQLATWKEMGLIQAHRGVIVVNDPVALALTVSLAARTLAFPSPS